MCFHSKQPKVFLQLVALVGNGLRGENGNDLRDWDAVTGQQLCHRDYDQPLFWVNDEPSGEDATPTVTANGCIEVGLGRIGEQSEA